MLKYNLKETIRTPVKTILFVILLAIITTFLSLGITLAASVNKSMEEVHAAFSTIGIVENPKSTGDYSPIQNSSFVTSYDRRDLLAGYSEEITVSPDADNWYREGTIYSIAEFKVNELSPPVATFTTILFRATKDLDSFHEGQNITLQSWGEEHDSFPFQVGKKYISLFRRDKYDSDYVITYFPEYVMEITSDNYQSTDEFVILAERMQEFKASIHTFPVYTTSDIKTMLSFHQGNTILTSGRLFTEQEYEAGEPVIIISKTMAERNNLGLGDTIALSFSQSQLKITGMGNDVFINPFPDKVAENTFEVVGIYEELLNMGDTYGIREDTLFIPKNSISYTPLPLPQFSNNHISFRLENGSSEAFMDEIRPYLDNINQSQALDTITSVTIYDQGYSKVTETLERMEQTGLLLTFIGAGTGLILIVMLGYLFIGKQKQTIAIMYSLGVNRHRAVAFLLTSVVMVTGLATIIGGSVGFFLSDNLINSIYTQSIEEVEISSSYSTIYGSNNQLDYNINLPNPFIPSLAAMIAVLILTLFISGIYAISILKQQPMQVLTDKEE